jgi:DNA-directed RNA polymerase specialized sigma24 family protein
MFLEIIRLALTTGQTDLVPSRATLTANQVREAVAALTDTDYLRLYLFGSALVGRADPEDVVHEAISRGLGGERRCPVGTNFLSFLMGSMRSIVSARFKGQRQNISIAASEDGAVLQLHSEDADAHAILEASETLIKIMSLFTDDAIASKVIRGMVEGRAGEELRLSVGLDKTAFATKQTLIRRRLRAQFPKGLPQ